MEGIITAIHGDIIEVEFGKELPNLNDALIVKRSDENIIVLEVHDHISDTRVKAIALGFTQGLKRGMTVIATGKPLQIPACRDCLGRVLDNFGMPIDGGPPLGT